ncbi:putative lipoprotein [Escherichia coli]|nr:putative lipoprotein [Escherichia coli]
MMKKFIAPLLALLVSGCQIDPYTHAPTLTSTDWYDVGMEDAISGSAIKDDDAGNDSNLLIVFYVQIMPDDFVMQLHRF